MTSASRASYSPESRVRTSSSSIALRSATELGLGLGAGVGVVLVLGQLARAPRGRRARLRRSSTRSDLGPARGDSLLVTFCASSGSSHRSGAAACCSRSAISALSRVDVRHLPDRLDGRSEVSELSGEVDGGHERPIYGSAGAAPHLVVIIPDRAGPGAAGYPTR